MPAPVPTPHLLAPYTAPPPAGSLTLCTSVINATHTWLMLSMLRDALAAKEDDVATGGPPQKPRLVLVSFVKKWDFWRSEARKMGLNLLQLAREGRFAFVDGVTELFTQEHNPSVSNTTGRTMSSATPSSDMGPASRAPRGVVPGIARTVDNKTPPQATNDQSKQRKLHYVSAGAKPPLVVLENDITAELSLISAPGEIRSSSSPSPASPSSSPTILILDNPDLLLAADPFLDVSDFTDFIMALRENSHAVCLSIAADEALIHNPTTPLETAHSSLAVTMAHMARLVIQCRGLDTGVARDVSGVVRMSRGGGFEVDGHAGQMEEREMLYHVKPDGGLSVFERGGA